MARQRDYRAEYIRRVEKGMSRGLTRSAARGHPGKNLSVSDVNRIERLPRSTQDEVIKQLPGQKQRQAAPIFQSGISRPPVKFKPVVPPKGSYIDTVHYKKPKRVHTVTVEGNKYRYPVDAPPPPKIIDYDNPDDWYEDFVDWQEEYDVDNDSPEVA